MNWWHAVGHLLGVGHLPGRSLLGAWTGRSGPVSAGPTTFRRSLLGSNNSVLPAGNPGNRFRPRRGQIGSSGQLRCSHGCPDGAAERSPNGVGSPRTAHQFVLYVTGSEPGPGARDLAASPPSRSCCRPALCRPAAVGRCPLPEGGLPPEVGAGLSVAGTDPPTTGADPLRSARTAPSTPPPGARRDLRT